MWAAGGWKRNQAPAPALSPIFGKNPLKPLSPPTVGEDQRVASSLTLIHLLL